MNFIHFTTPDGLIVEAKECVHPTYDNLADASVCIYDPKKRNAIVWDTMLAYNQEGLSFNVVVEMMFVPLSKAMVQKKLWSEETRKSVVSEVYSKLAAAPEAA